MAQGLGILFSPPAGVTVPPQLEFVEKGVVTCGDLTYTPGERGLTMSRPTSLNENDAFDMWKPFLVSERLEALLIICPLPLRLGKSMCTVPIRIIRHGV